VKLAHAKHNDLSLAKYIHPQKSAAYSRAYK